MSHSPVDRIILELLNGQSRPAREIASLLELSPDRVTKTCNRLVRRGLLATGSSAYSITETGKAAACKEPVDGTAKGSLACRFRDSLRARAWRVMRMKEWWSLDELLMTVADGTESDPGRNLSRYIRALRKAGYLIASQRDNHRYHLALNTGRLAPALNSTERTLTDPNTGERFHV